MTFNPTNATYVGTADADGVLESGLNFAAPNRWSDGNGDFNYDEFNYANYVGDEEAIKTLWNNKDRENIESNIYGINENNAKYYNRADALRAVVKSQYGFRSVAYLNIEGTETERALASGKTAYALIMLNPMETVSSDVEVSIYTDEGLIEFDESLSGMYNSKNEYVSKILPSVSNTVELEFDDEDIKEEDAFDVYTEEDLALFVDWNKSASGNLTANINADIELTKDVFNAMKAATKVTWNLSGSKKLTLAADMPANALDYAKLIIDDNLDVIVKGAVDFTKATGEKNSQIEALTIEEGATMNIKVAVDNDEISLPAITNKGTLNISAVQVLGAGVIMNDAKGTINVAAGADVKGAEDGKGVDNTAGTADDINFA